MKTVDATLQPSLDANPTSLVWVLQIHTRDGSGTNYRLTSTNKDVVGAATWNADPGFLLTSVRVSTGDQAAIIEFTIGADETTLIAKSDVIENRFRRGLARLYVADHKYPEREPLLVFKGYVGDVSYTDNNTVILEFGTRWRETRQIAVNKFAANCRWQLGDAKCGIDLGEGGGYNKAATVSAVTSRTQFDITVTESRADVAGWFANGAVKFVTGDNALDAYDIRRWAPSTNTVELWTAARAVIQVGDTLRIHPGCNKTSGNGGCGRYSNIDNFGGFEFMPPSDFNFGSLLGSP